MNREEIIKIYGLPEDASDEDVANAVKAGAQAIDRIAGERTKAEEAETAKAAAEREKEKAVAECRALKADAFVAANAGKIADAAACRAAYVKDPALAEAVVAACRGAAEPARKQQVLAAARGGQPPKAGGVMDALAACRSAEERCAFAVAHAKEIAEANK